ncbi:MULTISPECIES: hypothetical protein [unclassified Streptomyces]|uniref:hypothetical protein n=1 Tax=unclassified Streptomyces TaxID=2593676 RepID=UPI002252C93A|nr:MULTISPECIES: hypothetical protein [unclassified Streptomyces]MCX4989648.1 hypothetical protein [Streptomyces sp. NBC_00568]MCX5005112.1 hypothetical protein [Streptomyces sp. NBC_00638]
MLRRISARYSRGFLAAVIAVAALVTVANVGPARAAGPAPAAHTASKAAGHQGLPAGR